MMLFVSLSVPDFKIRGRAEIIMAKKKKAGAKSKRSSKPNVGAAAMSKMVEYDLGDGHTIVIEEPEMGSAGGGMAPVGAADRVVKGASENFERALATLGLLSEKLLAQVKRAKPDEVAIEVALQVAGEGKLIIASAKGQATFKAQLKWKDLKTDAE